MTHRVPDTQTVRAAVTLALRAPSIHNSQPWRWRMGQTSLHLYADRARWLHATDPGGADLLLSCGAALHHARMAFAALGWATRVHRLPTPSDPDHLAALEFSPKEPNPTQISMTKAITKRRTDRRSFSSWEVPDGLIDVLCASAENEGAVLIPMPAGRMRQKLAMAVAEAGARQDADWEYQDELATWTGRYSWEASGVPVSGLLSDPTAQWVDRRFPVGTLDQRRPTETEPDASELLVLASETDDNLARLRSGEATSAVLLEATAIGLGTCPLTHALEVASARDYLAEEVLDGEGFPQMIIRVGWAHPSETPLAETKRRPLDEVFEFKPF